MTDEPLCCIGCDQSFNANGYCAACDEYASEQPPAKTLEQVIAERPELQVYRDQLRARLWGIEMRGDPLRRVA
jgi:hypothetical protein